MYKIAFYNLKVRHEKHGGNQQVIKLPILLTLLKWGQNEKIVFSNDFKHMHLSSMSGFQLISELDLLRFMGMTKVSDDDVALLKEIIGDECLDFIETNQKICDR